MAENNTPIESDRRLVTVMFADISGFTAMSEKMDPEEVTDVMKNCFSMMEKVIDEYGGTIDKFIGDCVMVLFGAPRAQEDAPHRALNTALEIKKRLHSFNIENHLNIPLDIHIGINTGPVISGMMGGDKRQDFTVMGDTVNLASRMESSAKIGEILVAENTYRLTEGYFDFETVGGVKVKGKELPVKAYRVLGPRRIITRLEACQEKGLSPFVGRNKELEHLGDRLEQACAGHGQVVGVMGEPGVGKSRLIRQFRESLTDEEYTIIEGGCIHFGDAIPYLPILDMLRNFFKINEDEDEATIKQMINDKVAQISDQLTHILSPLYEILSLKVEDEEYVKLDGKQRRDKVFDAIRLILIAQSQKKPLVVIIEDLHWLDKISEEFLAFFINSIATSRTLLILLYRPEYTPSWVSKTYYSQIRVDQFSRKTIEDLVRGILESGELDTDLIDFIANRTEGNPLFIEEMTSNLLENKSIRKDGNKYSLSLKLPDIKVPATVQGIIAARIDRLEPVQKGLIQTASVIGREFPFRILQSVSTLKENIISSLLTLQDLELIYEKTIFPELVYIFKHALIQEVAYNSVLIKKRKEAHEKVGQAIEQIYADRLDEFYEILAYHYSLSDNALKAYQYLKISADKAAKNYASLEAIRFYQEALLIFKRQPETEECMNKKLPIYISLINQLAYLSYPQGTLEIFNEAECLAQHLKDEDALVNIYSRLGLYYTLTGNPMLGLEYSEKCFKTAERIEAVNVIARSAFDVGFAYYAQGNYPKVVDIIQRALLIIEKHQREETGGWIAYINLSVLYAQALAYLGMFKEGEDVLARCLHNANELNDSYLIGFVEFSYSFHYFFKGDNKATIEHSLESIKWLEKIKLQLFLGFSWTMLGGGYYLNENYDKAKIYVDKGLKLQKESGIPINTPPVCWGIAMVYFQLGNLEYAKSYADEGLKYARETNAKAHEGLLLTLLGRINSKIDPTHLGDQINIIRNGISILEEYNVKAWYSIGYLILGEFYADADQKDEALENLKKAESLYLDMKVAPTSYWLKRTREALAKQEQQA